MALPTNLELPSFVSVRDAIDDLPTLSNGETGAKRKDYKTGPQNDFQAAMRNGSNSVQNHEAPRLGEINIKRLSFIPPGGNWTDIPEDLLPKGMKRARRSDHTKRYGRVRATWTCVDHSDEMRPALGSLLPLRPRPLLHSQGGSKDFQTFPDKFRFAGSRVEQYEQVGNAVPPLLAAAIGRSIRAVLRSDARTRKKDFVTPWQQLFSSSLGIAPMMYPRWQSMPRIQKSAPLVGIHVRRALTMGLFRAFAPSSQSRASQSYAARSGCTLTITEFCLTLQAVHFAPA